MDENKEIILHGIHHIDSELRSKYLSLSPVGTGGTIGQEKKDT
jgi:hypothetical protein